MLKLLRQPRYAALSVLMAVVALVCIGAGSWQIARFEQKVHENDDLRANAHAPATTVEKLLPLVGHAGTPSRGRVEFRTVRVTGTYDATAQSLVRNRSVGDGTGLLVLTPLRMSGGVLLVVRGGLLPTSSGHVPAVPAPPAGPVSVLARLQAPERRHDAAAQLADRQVESINPTDQAARLGEPVYDGYAQLTAHQPGTAGLHVVGTPDLSNPAGGALEPQHFAYVIQWYLFAALAVAAPFVMARAENRQRRRGEIDFEAEAARGQSASPATPEPSDDQRRAAKLADRYGRPVV